MARIAASQVAVVSGQLIDGLVLIQLPFAADHPRQCGACLVYEQACLGLDRTFFWPRPRDARSPFPKLGDTKTRLDL